MYYILTYGDFAATAGPAARRRLGRGPRHLALLLLCQAELEGVAAAGHRRVARRGRVRAHFAPGPGQPGRERVRRLGPAHRAQVLDVRQLLAHPRGALSDQRGKRE